MTAPMTREERLREIQRLVLEAYGHLGVLLHDVPSTPKSRTDERAAEIADARRAELGLTPGLGPARSTPSEALARYGSSLRRRRRLTTSGAERDEESRATPKAEHAAHSSYGAHARAVRELLAGRWMRVPEIAAAVGRPRQRVQATVGDLQARGELKRRGTWGAYEYTLKAGAGGDGDAATE